MVLGGVGDVGLKIFFVFPQKLLIFAFEPKEKIMLTKYRIEYTECDFKREVERTKTKNWLKTICAYANGIGGMYDGILFSFRTSKTLFPPAATPLWLIC